MDEKKIVDFPELTDQHNEKINELFTSYVFYQNNKKGKECWCTHCNEHYVLPYEQRTYDEKYVIFLNRKHNETATCPKCGAKVTMKSYGRGREKLKEHHNIAIIYPQDKNEVYIRCVSVYKNYSNNLLGFKIYHDAEYVISAQEARTFKYYYGASHEENKITEPFYLGQMQGYDEYTVIGLNLLEDTFLKYIDLNKWEDICKQRYWGIARTISYICYCAKYPCVEMMMKSGYERFVAELVLSRRPNSNLINWEASESKDIFKNITGQDIKSYLNTGYELSTIRRFAQWHNKIKTVKIADVKDFEKGCRSYYTSERMINSVSAIFIKFCISPVKALNYLNKQCNLYKDDLKSSAHASQHISMALVDYRDYIKEAKELKLDLKNSIVLMPKNLIETHRTTSAVLNAQREIVEKANTKNLTKKLIKKLCFESDKYLIRIPQTVREIVEEGKAQDHCVGGYADRHFSGKLAIVFIREKKHPDVAFYTMEIDIKTSRIVQCRGKRNNIPDAEVQVFLENYKLELERRKNTEAKRQKSIKQKSINQKPKQDLKQAV